MRKPSPRSLALAVANVVLIIAALHAVSRVFAPVSTDRVDFVVWLFAGAVLHDAVFLPIYATLDLVVRTLVADNPLRPVRIVNHLRYPVVVSGVLLLVYFPTILDRNPGNFARVSGRPQATDPLQAWLLITVGLFAVSGAILGLRVVRGARRRHPAGA